MSSLVIITLNSQFSTNNNSQFSTNNNSQLNLLLLFIAARIQLRVL